MRKLLLTGGLVLSLIFSYAQSCNIVYVTTDGNETNDGSMLSPKDIVSAFDAALENSVIRIAAGTYYIDAPLNVPNGVRIEGGFIADQIWTKTSLAGATTIHRTADNPEGLPFMERLVALSAINKSGFAIHDITITTADAFSSGMSTYGVYISGCSNYKFVRCQILPGSGADGANGISGTAGANGTNGSNGGAGSCNGGDCVFGSGDPGGAGGNGGNAGGGSVGGTGGPATNGQANPGVVGNVGTGRNGGAGGGGGAGNDECSTSNAGAGAAGGSSACAIGGNGGNAGTQGNPGNPGTAGTAGEPGQPGENGNPGPEGLEINGFWIAGATAGNGTDGCGGAGGGGGGGGGRQTCAVFCDDGPGNGGGGGGGGGQGGTGGTGGTGGGSSFAVYARNNGANTKFIDCYINPGDAGLGGSGGAGGAGGTGGIGGLGNTTCNNEIGAGGNGGNGGNGGAGGNGGIGAAGLSEGLFLVSGVDFTTGSSTFDLAGQPEIWVSYELCFAKRITVTDKSIAEGQGVAAWSFGTNSIPLMGTNNPHEVIHMAYGPFNINQGVHTFSEFITYCCSAVSIQDIGWDELVVYPNPTDGMVHVNLGRFEKKIEVIAYDPTGRDAYSNTFSNTSNIEFSLPEQQGVYFIYLKFNNEKTIVKRIIKK